MALPVAPAIPAGVPERVSRASGPLQVRSSAASRPGWAWGRRWRGRAMRRVWSCTRSRRRPTIDRQQAVDPTAEAGRAEGPAGQAQAGGRVVLGGDRAGIVPGAHEVGDDASILRVGLALATGVAVGGAVDREAGHVDQRQPIGQRHGLPKKATMEPSTSRPARARRAARPRARPARLACPARLSGARPLPSTARTRCVSLAASMLTRAVMASSPSRLPAAAPVPPASPHAATGGSGRSAVEPGRRRGWLSRADHR